MEEVLKLFRLKTTWLQTNPADGGVSKVKTEEIVQAVSYTDAEKIAYEIADQENRCELGDIDIEIVRMKPCDIIFHNCLVSSEKLVCGLVENHFEGEENSGEGLYLVNYVIITIDEKSGKEKATRASLFVPATDNKNAYECAVSYLKNGMCDYTIKDIKFDKASSLLLDQKYYETIVNNHDLK